MKGMLVVRVERCLGCKSCETACAVEHSKSKNLYDAIHETPTPRARVNVANGEGFVVPLQCRQCEDAPCVEICPTKSLRRADQDSPVIIDHDLCIGCKWCLIACPFGVIALDERSRTVVKCDQCFERLERGELPACVSACPTRALSFETVEEILMAKRERFLVKIGRGLDGENK
ncbi:MAG: 4Fe-4S binding protein [Armatimonadetes bacterium]|nr:4Fe-4S binding protein [Armatimonadota bacterium]